MSYGIFDELTAGSDALEREANLEQRKVADAIFAAKERFGDYLGNAQTKSDYAERLRFVNNELHTLVSSHVFPTPGVMRRVKSSLRPKFANAKNRPTARRTASRKLSSTWVYDARLNSYVSNGTAEFKCPSCMTLHSNLGFNRCACGKVWNSWVVRSGDKTAAGDQYFCTEVYENDTKLANVKKRSNEDDSPYTETCTECGEDTDPDELTQVMGGKVCPECADIQDEDRENARWSKKRSARRKTAVEMNPNPDSEEFVCNDCGAKGIAGDLSSQALMDQKVCPECSSTNLDWTMPYLGKTASGTGYENVISWALAEGATNISDFEKWLALDPNDTMQHSLDPQELSDALAAWKQAEQNNFQDIPDGSADWSESTPNTTWMHTSEYSSTDILTCNDCDYTGDAEDFEDGLKDDFLCPVCDSSDISNNRKGRSDFGDIYGSRKTAAGIDFATIECEDCGHDGTYMDFHQSLGKTKCPNCGSTDFYNASRKTAEGVSNMWDRAEWAAQDRALASCDSCGWSGLEKDLVPNYDDGTEYCPQCNAGVESIFYGAKDKKYSSRQNSRKTTDYDSLSHPDASSINESVKDMECYECGTNYDAPSSNGMIDSDECPNCGSDATYEVGKKNPFDEPFVYGSRKTAEDVDAEPFDTSNDFDTESDVDTSVEDTDETFDVDLLNSVIDDLVEFAQDELAEELVGEEDTAETQNAAAEAIDAVQLIQEIQDQEELEGQEELNMSEFTTAELQFIAGWRDAKQGKPVPSTKSRTRLEGYIAFLKSAESYDTGVDTSHLTEVPAAGEPVGVDVNTKPGEELDVYEDVRGEMANQFDEDNEEGQADGQTVNDVKLDQNSANRKTRRRPSANRK
jgi:Zn finger protein HypA/HybF involved in hydrogenase expression